MIMARTDALSVNGMDEALERAALYEEAGADMIFIEALETVDQMKGAIADVTVPQLANVIPGGKTPNLSAKELEEIGFAAAAYPTISVYAEAKTMQNIFSELLRTGSVTAFNDQMIEFNEFNRLVGLNDIRDIEEKYINNFK